jgi:hypothetical protein
MADNERKLLESIAQISKDKETLSAEFAAKSAASVL